VTTVLDETAASDRVSRSFHHQTHDQNFFFYVFVINIFCSFGCILINTFVCVCSCVSTYAYECVCVCLRVPCVCVCVCGVRVRACASMRECVCMYACAYANDCCIQHVCVRAICS